ncbi:MAG: DinB family protein, partial [Methyloceanibacter sp.]|nr:DinB family protein [Methyloceanibacter sp.]
AYNNAWASHRLLSACEHLGPGELEAPRTGFFPSIAATLSHTLTVDWYYVDALGRAFRGAAPNPGWESFFDPECPFTTIEPLAGAQRAVDRRLVEVCVARDDEELMQPVDVPRRTGLAPERADRLLAHLFQHQIHHRAARRASRRARRRASRHSS